MTDAALGTYECSACHNVFNKITPDDEALDEARGIFGADLGSDPAIVCDNCWTAMCADGAADDDEIQRRWDVATKQAQ